MSSWILLTKSLKSVRSLISGEHPEAMQTESASGCHQCTWLLTTALLLLLLIKQTFHCNPLSMRRLCWWWQSNSHNNTAPSERSRETTKTTSTTDHTSTPCKRIHEQFAANKIIIDLHNNPDNYMIKNHRNCCWHHRHGHESSHRHHHSHRQHPHRDDNHHNCPHQHQQLEIYFSWYNREE